MRHVGQTRIPKLAGKALLDSIAILQSVITSITQMILGIITPTQPRG